MPSLKHTHQYIKFHSRPELMRCAHPDCTHFIAKELLEGKTSLCNECGKSFTLTFYDLKRAKPLGPCCSKRKEAIAEREVKDKLKSLFREDGTLNL
jgi:hypothetical protein